MHHNSARSTRIAVETITWEVGLVVAVVVVVGLVVQVAIDMHEMQAGAPKSTRMSPIVVWANVVQYRSTFVK